ncbi:MAG: transcriptional regulator [Nitrosopumilus sp.]
MEEEFFKNVCSIKPVENKNKPSHSIKKWITLNDSILASVIIEAFGDVDKKKILASVTGESKIIYDVLYECKIPQTFGYRKINSLIKNGLLLIDGFIETPDGKKINKYQTIFQNVNINIIKNKVTVDIQMNEKSIETSSIILAMNAL